jgi:hypothetical protein
MQAQRARYMQQHLPHFRANAWPLPRLAVSETGREFRRHAHARASFMSSGDLRELEFMACVGLRVIVNAHRRWAGRVILVRGPACVQQVFEISGLARLLPFVDEPPKGEGTNARFARDATRRDKDQDPASDGCCAGRCR